MGVFVIAEAGVNHNGDLAIAVEMVRVAKNAGADAIKFQTFKAAELATSDAPKAKYQAQTTDINETHFEMLRRLELSSSDHLALVEECNKLEIEFLSTPFDTVSLKFLVSELEVGKIKLSSGEITNGPLLLEAAYARIPIILSTGMSSIDEVRQALSVLAFGFCGGDTPSDIDLKHAYKSIDGEKALRKYVSLLHCTSEYPASFKNINLCSMQTLRDEFGLQVGFSDHSQGINVSIGAAALGACIVEKHFTLDRGLPGPDHIASVQPEDLKLMITGIRHIESSLGNGVKKPSRGELENRLTVRKSLTANCDISEGENFTPHNIGIKRPGGGISPMRYWEFMNMTAVRNYRRGELINQ